MLIYVPVPEAIALQGLRLVVNEGTPAPWSEAVKAIFRIKGISFVPVPHRIADSPDEALWNWTGSRSAPVAMFDDERPRTSWDQILLLAERLNPNPRLIPEDERERALMMGVIQEITGEDGFGWNCRTYLIEVQSGSASDPLNLANHDHGMSQERWEFFRYRYLNPGSNRDTARIRVESFLRFLTQILYSNRDSGSRYVIGNSLSAADLYWTAFSNLIAPLKPEQCPQSEFYQNLGRWFGDHLGASLDPILLEHREYILDNHFPLPMWL